MGPLQSVTGKWIVITSMLVFLASLPHRHFPTPRVRFSEAIVAARDNPFIDKWYMPEAPARFTGPEAWIRERHRSYGPGLRGQYSASLGLFVVLYVLGIYASFVNERAIGAFSQAATWAFASAGIAVALSFLSVIRVRISLRLLFAAVTLAAFVFWILWVLVLPAV